MSDHAAPTAVLRGGPGARSDDKRLRTNKSARSWRSRAHGRRRGCEKIKSNTAAADALRVREGQLWQVIIICGTAKQPSAVFFRTTIAITPLQLPRIRGRTPSAAWRPAALDRAPGAAWRAWPRSGSARSLPDGMGGLFMTPSDRSVRRPAGHPASCGGQEAGAPRVRAQIPTQSS
jgi:hypothetical protein